MQEQLRPQLVVLKSKKLLAHMQRHQGSHTCDSWWALVDGQYGRAWRQKVISERLRHPLGYPARLSPAGTPICRLHNYADCLTENCGFTHAYCAECLAEGHRAQECPQLMLSKVT